ncbi:MAG TPA: class I SAM-dependent methyltransferase, partial [Solirubrobacteraceae bacterium]|nr:class I SAM-dependent methyltransferase [Solirubrobacteraceae bacterium]
MDDLSVLVRLVPVSGRDVVDIGCGGGVLVRALTARGARVTGVEISESQLASAIRDDDGNGARYVVGLAQSLPLDDASVDVVVFMRALHHGPQADMLAALGEARRVLRPGGAVYIAEPLAEGDFFELTSLI